MFVYFLTPNCLYFLDDPRRFLLFLYSLMGAYVCVQKLHFLLTDSELGVR
jgi:hypothetical protein